MSEKLPPKCSITVVVFPPDHFVIVLEREDGKKLMGTMTREDLENLVEYMSMLIRLRIAGKIAKVNG